MGGAWALFVVFIVVIILMSWVLFMISSILPMLHVLGGCYKCPSCKHVNLHAGYDRWIAYGHSKLSNVLFARELDRRLKAAGSPVKVGTVWVVQGRTSASGLQGSAVSPRLNGFRCQRARCL